MIELIVEVPENKKHTLIIEDKDKVYKKNTYFVDIDDFCLILYQEGYNKGGKLDDYLLKFSGMWHLSLPKEVWIKVFEIAV